LNANAGSRVVLDDVGQFRVGSKANFIAFDGTNIWITNTGDNNVTKLRACDGGFLGNFPTGVGPLGTAFDGVNVWVSNALDGTISQM
jgi:DNA-binding beta-propeller fold protein YncE